MDGRTRDIESWKREKRKLLEGAETKGESRKNKTAREWTKGPQRIAFGRKRGADVDAARGDSDWRQGFFGERSERNWKMRRRGLTLAASGTINVCARLQTCPLCPPFRSSSRLGRGKCRENTDREDEAGGSNSTIRIHGSTVCLIGPR